MRRADLRRYYIRNGELRVFALWRFILNIVVAIDYDIHRELKLGVNKEKKREMMKIEDNIHTNIFNLL